MGAAGRKIKHVSFRALAAGRENARCRTRTYDPTRVKRVPKTPGLVIPTNGLKILRSQM